MALCQDAAKVADVSPPAHEDAKALRLLQRIVIRPFSSRLVPKDRGILTPDECGYPRLRENSFDQERV